MLIVYEKDNIIIVTTSELEPKFLENAKYFEENISNYIRTEVKEAQVFVKLK